jgi:hypothetical protein
MNNSWTRLLCVLACSSEFFLASSVHPFNLLRIHASLVRPGLRLIPLHLGLAAVLDLGNLSLAERSLVLADGTGTLGDLLPERPFALEAIQQLIDSLGGDLQSIPSRSCS